MRGTIVVCLAVLGAVVPASCGSSSVCAPGQNRRRPGKAEGADPQRSERRLW
jgi:hypothetical protein